jgi:hypothetical protein
MKRRRLALVVAAVFTALAALWFLASVAIIAASLYYRPTVEMNGSGGIGAVSSSVYALVATLAYLAAVLYVNFSVALQARQRGRGAVWTRRAHLLIIVVTLVVPVIAVTAFSTLISWLPGGHGIAWDRTLINLFITLVLAGAVLAAIHAAFGVFAIGLLRRQP